MFFGTNIKKIHNLLHCLFAKSVTGNMSREQDLNTYPSKSLKYRKV